MPHRASLYRWARLHPRFAQAMGLARQAAGRSARSAQLSTFCPVVAHEICERLAEGETLAGICADPFMPGFSTVHRWRRAFPEFAAQYEQAREAQADRLVDEGLEATRRLAADAPYAVHVRLTHLRWAAGMMRPHAWRVRQAEAPEPPKVLTTLIRSFEVEEDLEAGMWRVKGYRPDPGRGEPVCDSEGEWKPMPEPVLERARREAWLYAQEVAAAKARRAAEGGGDGEAD